MISVSYLKSIDDKKTTIQKIDASEADMIHIDLMDGMYAGACNFKLEEIITDFKDTSKPLDIHLMVKKPSRYIASLAKLNSKIITIHIDIDENVKDVIELINDYNITAGIALNPTEDISLIDKYLPLIEYVLIMSVNPGLGGQKFIPSVVSKIEYLNQKNKKVGIDGGINDNTVKYLKRYQIYNIISGSFVCMHDDYNKQIELLKKSLLAVNEK